MCCCSLAYLDKGEVTHEEILLSQLSDQYVRQHTDHVVNDSESVHMPEPAASEPTHKLASAASKSVKKPAIAASTHVAKPVAAARVAKPAAVHGTLEASKGGHLTKRPDTKADAAVQQPGPSFAQGLKYPADLDAGCQQVSPGLAACECMVGPPWTHTHHVCLLKQSSRHIS